LVVENRSKDVDCLLPGKCVQKNPVGYSCLVLFSLSRCRVRDVCCWGPSVAGLVCGGRCRGWCRGRCRGHVVGDGVSSLSVGVTVRLSGSEEAVLLGVLLVGDSSCQCRQRFVSVDNTVRVGVGVVDSSPVGERMDCLVEAVGCWSE